MIRAKWIYAILLVSLAVNLLLVGFVVGQSSKPALFGDPTRAFPRWVRTLPEERQVELRPTIRAHLGNMRPAMRQMRSQHQRLQDALRADPFDAELLAAALAELRANHARVQESSHRAFVGFVNQLTPAERQALVEDLRAPRPAPWHRPTRP